MGKIIAWILCLIILGLLDLPNMWRKKDRYEMGMFGALLVVGVVYGILSTLGIPLPDPNQLVRDFFEPLGKRLMKSAV
ncbi:hypothetical protein LSG31_17130 [Fodinisporobacter ferrooxydans]|uniref:Uncharacterized protein n=1 Tax=Fodinisporobacter ferrooxydans TaxID=2901836 RepID=A0ABY4CGE7_9BACL|nr:hypothetical protein LSG31_17130 [Alicyclobacillaceae bacterium MYW30-H2]